MTLKDVVVVSLQMNIVSLAKVSVLTFLVIPDRSCLHCFNDLIYLKNRV